MKVTVYKIKYDTDGARVKLPKKLEIEVPTEITDQDEILDYLCDQISNITGFCHNGFAIKPMTKQEFLSLANFTPYTGMIKDNNVNAVFFEWQSGEEDGKYFAGFKYCFYGRAILCKKTELMNTMYAYVTGKITDLDVPYWINMKIAQKNSQRFKVPLSWKW